MLVKQVWVFPPYVVFFSVVASRDLGPKFMETSNLLASQGVCFGRPVQFVNRCNCWEVGDHMGACSPG